MNTELTYKTIGAASARGAHAPRVQCSAPSRNTPLDRYQRAVLVGEGAGQCSRGGCAPRKSQRAFSLIELIGVLAVIAILAAVAVPTLIRQMDRIAGERESASLKSFGDALQQSIVRNRSVPSDTNW